MNMEWIKSELYKSSDEAYKNLKLCIMSIGDDCKTEEHKYLSLCYIMEIL